jgi:uncharacterized phage infection (PIP) family protein YhgE
MAATDFGALGNSLHTMFREGDNICQQLSNLQHLPQLDNGVEILNTLRQLQEGQHALFAGMRNLEAGIEQLDQRIAGLEETVETIRNVVDQQSLRLEAR